MFKKKIIWIMLISFVFSCYWGKRMRDPEKKADRFIEKISSHLDLNEKQKNFLEKNKTQYVQMEKECHAQHRDLHQNIMSQIDKDAINAQQIKQQLQKKHDSCSKVHGFMADKLVSFHGILSKEQKEKLANTMKKRMKCYPNRRCPWNRRGYGWRW